VAIDLSSGKGPHVSDRLRDELVIWLTTGGERPQSVPVWFLWEDGGFLVYSVPGRKVDQLAAHPRVHLNFNSTRTGGDVVRFEGLAEVLREAPPATANRGYMDKYKEQIDRLGMTPDGFAEEYRVAIRIKPERLKG
jgi:PPOX class probable F420-dependent enzyme